MQTWLKRTASAAVCMSLIAGCATGPAVAGAPPSLDGTSWVLASLPGHTLLERPPVTLQFAGGRRLAGGDGCNRYAGSWNGEGEAFSVAPGLASTQMACAPEVNEQARAYASALLAARKRAFVDGQLVLQDADGRALAAFRPQPRDLAGTRWRATGINDGRGAVTSLVAGTEVTLEFAADGRASGSATCNRYTAGYTASGDSLRFERPALTRMACPGLEAAAQEQAFIAALESAATAQIEGERLELRTPGGALAASFVRAPAD